MSTLLNKTTEYGLRAVLYIALNQSEKRDAKRWIDTEEIARDLKIPHHFLAKVIQKLVKAGIIYSKRGKNGGFRLKKSPEKMKLLEIVFALEGENFLKDCVFGLPNCSDKNPCPVHSYWRGIREEIKRMFSEKTLKELLKGDLKI
ncbi:MAG: RrF2 family transcriptional regulator [Candidatus Kryptonium sp.]